MRLLSLLGFLTLLGCGSSPKWPAIRNCDHVFTVGFLLGSKVYEYDDQKVWSIRDSIPPPRSYFSQTTYSCRYRAIISTFNPGDSSGPVDEILSIKNALLKHASSGLLIDYDKGKRELVSVPYTPYVFAEYGDDLIIQTGRIQSTLDDVPGASNKPHDIIPAEKLNPTLYTKVLRFNVPSRRIVAEYPTGFGLQQIFLMHDLFYTFSKRTVTDLKTGLYHELAPPMMARYEIHAVTDDNEVFYFVPEWLNEPFATEKPHLETNTVYEIVNNKHAKVLSVDIKGIIAMIGVGTDIYLFSDNENSEILRYNTIDKTTQHFNFPHKYLADVAFDGENFILMTNPGGPNRLHLRHDQNEYFLYVADKNFQHIVGGISFKSFPGSISTRYMNSRKI